MSSFCLMQLGHSVHFVKFREEELASTGSVRPNVMHAKPLLCLGAAFGCDLVQALLLTEWHQCT